MSILPRRASCPRPLFRPYAFPLNAGSVRRDATGSIPKTTTHPLHLHPFPSSARPPPPGRSLCSNGTFAVRNIRTACSSYGGTHVGLRAAGHQEVHVLQLPLVGPVGLVQAPELKEQVAGRAVRVRGRRGGGGSWWIWGREEGGTRARGVGVQGATEGGAERA